MIDRYKLLITGRNTSYFLKNLLRKNVQIYKIENTKDGIKIIVDKKDYKDIINMKTIYKIKVVNRYGIGKFKYLLTKYLIFIISLFISFILLTVLSNMIFSIQVIHTDEDIRNIVLRDLEEKGIKKYHFKVSFEEKEKIKTLKRD